MMAASMVPLALYRAGGIGGGDVKLLAAMGALCGLLTGVEMELYAFIGAAMYAAVRLAYRGTLLRTVWSAVILVGRAVKPGWRPSPSDRPREEMRFGPAVLAGVCFAAFAQGQTW